eukprot:3633857-Rhodomonas_salina.2
MLTIVVSMLALATEPPTRDIEAAVPYHVLDMVNIVSTAVFSFEFLVQVCLGERAAETACATAYHVFDCVVIADRRSSRKHDGSHHHKCVVMPVMMIPQILFV